MTAIMLVICAQLAVNIFKGQSYFCSRGNYAIQEDCLNYGGDWVNYHFNFDSMGNALLSLVCMPWEIMYKNVASNYFLPFVM